MSTQLTAPRSRRALLAAAAGAAAATVVAAVERPATVLAGSDGDVVLGAQNNAASTTLIMGRPDLSEAVLAVEGRDLAIQGASEYGTALLGLSWYGTALQVAGKAKFSRSGRAVVRARTSAVTVDLRPMGGLAGSPLCFATVQGFRPGVWVVGVRPNYPRSGRLRIYLNRVLSSRLTVAWVVLDPLPLT